MSVRTFDLHGLYKFFVVDFRCMIFKILSPQLGAVFHNVICSCYLFIG